MNTEQNLSPFDIFAKEYDASYDSQEGKIFYENEKKCIEKFLNIENFDQLPGFVCIEVRK